MYRACIAVVDASRARLFTFERTSEAAGPQEQLTEQRDLVNPARRLRMSELFSDSRPGVGRSGRGGSLQYGFDDHRTEHVDNMDAEFSRAVVDEIAELLRAAPAQRLIVCASPRTLGLFRDAGPQLRRDGLVIDEVPRDLTKLTPPQLRNQLARYGVLPQVPARVALQ